MTRGRRQGLDEFMFWQRTWAMLAACQSKTVKMMDLDEDYYLVPTEKDIIHLGYLLSYHCPDMGKMFSQHSKTTSEKKENGHG
jgi:hypothetical protein